MSEILLEKAEVEGLENLGLDEDQKAQLEELADEVLNAGNPLMVRGKDEAGFSFLWIKNPAGLPIARLDYTFADETVVEFTVERVGENGPLSFKATKVTRKES